MILKPFHFSLFVMLQFSLYGDGHNIIWHMTNRAESHSAWDNVTFTPTYSDSGSNDYSTVPNETKAQVNNWNEAAQQLQHNLAKYEQFQAKYKELAIDINYVGRLLQEAKPSNDSSHIFEIIELVEFASGSGSNSFQKSVAELLVKLEPYLIDQSGNIRQSLSWLESWRYNSILSEFTARTSEWYPLRGAIECGQDTLYGSYGKYDFMQSGNKQLLARYLNNAQVKQYFDMRDFLKQGNFAQAYDIVLRNSFRFSKPAQNFLLARYQQELKSKYNFQGIKNEYLDTSYYKSHLTSLPASQIPSACNTAIERYLEVQQKVCGYRESVSAATGHIVEKIQEIGLDNKQAVIEYFCKELCSDHSDHEKAQAHSKISNHFGGPKWLRYNQLVQSRQFNSAIKMAAHTGERMLVAQLGLLNCPQEFARIDRALGYLDKACGSDELALCFATFGRQLAEDILTGKFSDISQLPDFNRSVPAGCEKTQAALIILSEELLLKAEQSQEKINPTLLNNICRAHEGMCAGRKIETVYLQECLLPTPCIMALNLELPVPIYGKIGMPQHVEMCCEQIKARVEACRDIEKNGFIVARTHDRFTPQERIGLINSGFDPIALENFYGNQLERVDHHFRMLDLKEIVHAKEQKFHPAIAPLIEFAIKSDSLCQLYSDYKIHGTMYALGTIRSMTVGCIKQMYVIDRDITVGIAQGVWDGVKNVGYMATHPQQTLTEMAQGIDSLAQVLDHCLWRFNEFVIDVYRQPEKAQGDFGSFCESALKLNQEIRQKIYEKGFAECSRECAKFATETFLIGKLTDFALIGCNAIETQARHILDSYKGLAQKAESITAVTAEGVEIRLTQKAENCFFNEIQDSSRKLPQGIVSVDKLPQLSEKAIEEAVRYATTERKIEHIFNKIEHKLEPLIQSFGNKEDVIRAILDASAGKLPASGVFKDVVVNVAGYDVYIRGSVMDGVPKLGTFFIK